MRTESSEERPWVWGRPGNGWSSFPQAASSHFTAGDGPITAASHVSTVGTTTFSLLVVTVTQSCPGSGYCRQNKRNDPLNLSFPSGP